MTPFDCPNCKGEGRIWGRGPANELKPSPCSPCGGSGIDPELREKVAKELFESEEGDWERLKHIPNRSFARGIRQEWLGLADMALAAVVAYWKEKE